MKKSLLHFLLIFSITSLTVSQSIAQGCVAIRYMPGASSSHGDGEHKRWNLAVGYRHFDSYKHYRGDDMQEERIEENTEVVNTVNSFDVSLTYAVNSKSSFTLGIPYTHNRRSSMYEHGNVRNHMNSRGIGDARILYNYWLSSPEKSMTRDVQLSFGFKLPTGDYSAMGIYHNNSQDPIYAPVDQSIQLGDGGWGLIAQGQFYHYWGRFMLNGSGFYMANPRDTNGVIATGRNGVPRSDSLEVGAIAHVMSVPDQYVIRVGGQYMLSETRPWSVSLGARMEAIPTYDLIGKSHGFRRPGMVVSVEPGLVWEPGNHQFSLNVPLAVYRNRTKNTSDLARGAHGDAAFADYMIQLGYNLSF